MNKELTPKELLAIINGTNRDFFITKKGESIPPTFFFYRHDGDDITIMTPWKNETEKDIMTEGLKEKIKELGDVYMYAFVAEGWSVTLPPGEKLPEDMRPKIRPRKDPRRVEIIIIQITHRSGERLMQSTQIIRNDLGRVVELKIEPDSSGGQVLHDRFDLFELGPMQ